MGWGCAGDSSQVHPSFHTTCNPCTHTWWEACPCLIIASPHCASCAKTSASTACSRGFSAAHKAESERTKRVFECLLAMWAICTCARHGEAMARSPLLWRASALARSASSCRSAPPLTMFSLPAAKTAAVSRFSAPGSGWPVQQWQSSTQLVWREQQRAGVSTTGPHQRPEHAAAGRNPSIGAYLQPVHRNQRPNVSVQADRILNVRMVRGTHTLAIGGQGGQGTAAFCHLLWSAVPVWLYFCRLDGRTRSITTKSNWHVVVARSVCQNVLGV